MNKIRNSSYELLRIILMLMIVSYHYACHGITDYITDINSWNQLNVTHRFFISFLLPGGYVGVSVFFMITGYFLIGKQSRNFLNIIKTLSFYVILNVIFFVFIEEKQKCLVDLSCMVLQPIASNSWWFVTSYVFLMLLLPFINSKLNLLNKKGLLLILIIMYLYSYVIPTCFQVFNKAPLYIFQRALFFYSLGAYIRKYTCPIKRSKTYLYLVFCILLWILNSFLKFKFNFSQSIYVKFFVDGIRNFVTVPLISIYLLKSFEAFQLKDNKVINIISSTTFGIYLFHDSFITQKLLWNKIFKVYEFQLTSKYFILYALLSIISIFGVGIVIELFRFYIIEKKLCFVIFDKYKSHIESIYFEKDLSENQNEKNINSYR